MTHPNLELIGQFFEAYGRHDHDGLCRVLAADVRWVFPGRNPLSGTKQGITELVGFFDAMGGLMSKANPRVEKLITAANDDYVIEGQHIHAEGADGRVLDTTWCVIWKFEGGKIVEGRHLAADQYAADEFFSGLAG